MNPVAAYIHDDILFVVFSWESADDEKKYALNIRDAIEGVELAEELIRPILLKTDVIQNELIECAKKSLPAEETERDIVCCALESLDLHQIFIDQNRVMPDRLRHIVNEAFSIGETLELEASISERQEIEVDSVRVGRAPRL